MNANVQVLNTPTQMINDLKNLDVAVLNSTLINTPESIVTTINHLYSELSRPGVDKDKTNTQITIMREILDTKITLTKHVLGVSGNTHAFVSNNMIQQQIAFEPKKVENITSTVQAITEIPVQSPIIVNGFKPEPTKSGAKVIQMTPIAKNTLPFFEGYVRRTVFGTAIELPKKAQELLAKYNSTSGLNSMNIIAAIDEIVKEITKVEQYEDALNLMIDMRTAADTKVKIETIEKEFLFQILPWVLEVGVEPKDNMQNISLIMWVDQLKQKKVPTNPINKLQEVIKEIPGLSANSASPEGSAQLINTIEGGIATKTEDVVDLSEDTKKIQELETTVIENLNKGMATGKAMKDFYTKVRSIVSFDKNKDLIKETWSKCLSTWKDSLQNKAEAGIETIESKDTIVEMVTATKSIEVKNGKIVVDAQTNVNKTDPEDLEYAKAEFEQTAKAMILSSLTDSTINAKNEFDKIAKKAGARKMFKDLNIAYKAWRTDIIAANPGLLEERKTVIKKPLFKVINIAEKHPDVWETAKLTKNLEEFKDLISTIIFDKTKELPNGWIIGANLVDQYINNFEETKSLETDTKNEWFQSFMDAKVKERKDIADKKAVSDKTKSKEPIVTTSIEEVKEIIQTVEEAKIPEIVEKVIVIEKPKSSKSFDAKKYESIATEGNKGKLNALSGDFLLEESYGTLESRKTELITMLRNNKRYTKSKDIEITNYIAKIIASNGAISKLA